MYAVVVGLAFFGLFDYSTRGSTDCGGWSWCCCGGGGGGGG